VVGVALALLALGRHNPLLTLPWGEPLGGAVLRYPERLLPLACLPVAVAAAAGWQVIVAARRDGRRLPVGWWVSLGGAGLFLAAVSALAGTGRLFPVVGLDLAGEEAARAGAFVLRGSAIGLLGLALLAACVWLAGRRRWEGVAAAFCPLLLAADLLAVNGGLNPTVSPELLTEVPPAAVALREAAVTNRFPPRLLRRSTPTLAVESASSGAGVAWWRRSLSDRIPTAFGIETCLVKDVDRSAPVGQAYLRVAHRRAAGATQERLADRAAAAWELGFAREPDEIPAGGRLVDPVFSGAAGLWLRRRSGAAPPVDIVPRGRAVGALHEPETLPRLIALLGDPAADPRQVVYLTGRHAESVDGQWRPGEGEVTIIRKSPVELVLEAALPGKGVLVVRQSFVRGWSVEVDGEAARLLRTDLAWRGVPLEAGRHTIRCTFRQPGLATGAWLSAAGLLLCLGPAAGRAVARRLRRLPLQPDGREEKRP
jgi:hypothetical protein